MSNPVHYIGAVAKLAQELQLKKEITHRAIRCAGCGKIIAAYYDDGIKSKIVDIDCRRCKRKNIVLI